MKKRNRKCSIDGCDRPHRSRGYCKTHYNRHITGKPMTDPIRVSVVRPDVPCAVDGCDDVAVSKAYCLAHYQRLRSGKPMSDPIREIEEYSCSECGVALLGYKSELCKKCNLKSWKRKNPDYRRAPAYVEKEYWYRRAGAYGITREQWESMYSEQSCACAVCLDAVLPEKMHTDHCHDSGIVRGLLCSNCNVAAGFMQDEPLRAMRLSDYLAKYAFTKTRAA